MKTGLCSMEPSKGEVSEPGAAVSGSVGISTSRFADTSRHGGIDWSTQSCFYLVKEIRFQGRKKWNVCFPQVK